MSINFSNTDSRSKGEGVKLFYQKSDFSPAGIFGPGGISDSVIIAYLELFSLKEYVNQISRTVKSVHS